MFCFGNLSRCWAEIPNRNMLSELNFFKSQITNYPSVVSRRKLSFEGLNFEEITPFRSLEGSLEYEYSRVSGLLTFARTSVETASHRYPSSSDLHGMIPLKFKPLMLGFLFNTRLG